MALFLQKLLAFVHEIILFFTMDIMLNTKMFFIISHLTEEERAGCFTLIVFFLSSICYNSALCFLPHVGWSAVMIVTYPGQTRLIFGLSSIMMSHYHPRAVRVILCHFYDRSICLLF